MCVHIYVCIFVFMHICRYDCIYLDTIVANHTYCSMHCCISWKCFLKLIQYQDVLQISKSEAIMVILSLEIFFVCFCSLKISFDSSNLKVTVISVWEGSNFNCYSACDILLLPFLMPRRVYNSGSQPFWHRVLVSTDLGLGWGIDCGLGMTQVHTFIVHFILLLLHQLHFRSPIIRFQSLGAPGM